MPQNPHNRFSTLSSVGSVISLSSDSKYPVGIYAPVPVGTTHSTGAFLPYSDNPHVDYQQDQIDEDDVLHDPDAPSYKRKGFAVNWRGLFNVTLVFLIIGALLTLFAGYPVITYYTTNQLNFGRGAGVNATGQAPYLLAPLLSSLLMSSLTINTL